MSAYGSAIYGVSPYGSEELIGEGNPVDITDLAAVGGPFPMDISALEVVKSAEARSAVVARDASAVIVIEKEGTP